MWPFMLTEPLNHLSLLRQHPCLFCRGNSKLVFIQHFCNLQFHRPPYLLAPFQKPPSWGVSTSTSICEHTPGLSKMKNKKSWKTNIKAPFFLGKQVADWAAEVTGLPRHDFLKGLAEKSSWQQGRNRRQKRDNLESVCKWPQGRKLMKEERRVRPLEKDHAGQRF